MYKLRKIDISSVALYSFIMLLVISFIFMIPFGLIMTAVSSMMPYEEMGGGGIPAFFSGIFLFILPFIYAIFGTVVNVLLVLLYNLLSSKFGGIAVELNHVDGPTAV